MKTLHPLARQAVDLAQRTDCFGWAFGLTRFMTYGDPYRSIRWTRNLLMSGDWAADAHVEVVARSVDFLDRSLFDPSGTSVDELDQFAWLPWSYRGESTIAGPVARLIWAMAEAKREATGDVPSEPSGTQGPLTWENVVGQQCGMAIQMVANNRAEIVEAVASDFTSTVCYADEPCGTTVSQQLEWAWHDIRYGIAVLQDGAAATYFRFLQYGIEAPLYSGPFSIDQLDDRLELLAYAPRTVRFVRLQ